MEFIIIFMAGVFVGISIMLIVFRTYLLGALHVDKSDPEDNPYMFLELSKGVDAITSKKYVILKVNLKNFIPHK